MKKIILLIFLTIISINDAMAVCAGPVLDPISRVRWNCVLPITIAGISVGSSGYALADTMDVNAGVGTQSPICLCYDPLPRIGITIGYREPIRLIESNKDPWCFPSLGFGMSSTVWSGGTKEQGSQPKNDTTVTHMWYFLPWAIMDLFMDIICMQTDLSAWSLAYTSEVDITSMSDTAALLLNPESVLFANPVAIMACEIPDAIATVAEYTIPPLYWCAGNHAIFPLSNHQVSKSNYTESAEVNASKTIFKMHRELQLYGSLGSSGLCGEYPMPIWNKMQYRLQTAMPVPDWYCRRLGQPSLLWNRGLNPTVNAGQDNMVFILWRKRDCCAF